MNTSNRGHNSIHDVHSGLKSDRLLSVLPVSTYCCMHGTRKGLKPVASIPTICILAFSRHNSRTEGFIKNQRGIKQEKPKMNPYVRHFERRNERCRRWSGNRHTSTVTLLRMRAEGSTYSVLNAHAHTQMVGGAGVIMPRIRGHDSVA